MLQGLTFVSAIIAFPKEIGFTKLDKQIATEGIITNRSSMVIKGKDNK